MKKLKHAVLGLGWFGEKHCEALAAIPNVEIAAVCTRNSERLADCLLYPSDRAHE